MELQYFDCNSRNTDYIEISTWKTHLFLHYTSALSLETEASGELDFS